MAERRKRFPFLKSTAELSKRRKKRMERRRPSQLERLEGRLVLAGPELFAIRPDEQALLNAGDTLHVAPREFNLLFKGNADIDSATIADGVSLIRAGNDGIFGNANDRTVCLGFVGLNDPANPVQIVMRPASSAQHNSAVTQAVIPAQSQATCSIGNGGQPMMPDDLYRIRIDSDLENTQGEAFSGVFTLDFRLDLGAQVIAVVPQPISRDPMNPGTGLSQDKRQITVYFDNQDLDPAAASDPKFYRVIDMALTTNESAGSNDRLVLPQTVIYNPNSNTAVLTFADPLGEGTHRLEIGHSDEPNSTLATAVNVGSILNGSGFQHLSYLGNGTGTSSDTADKDWYKTRLTAGTTVTFTAAPREGALDIGLRLMDNTGADITATATPTAGGAGAPETLAFNVANSGDYYLEVNSAAGVGSYQLTITTLTAVTINDNNSSLTSSTDLGILGVSGHRLSSAITRQRLALPQYPGSEDEPGHRQIQAESHGAGIGVDPTLPNGISVLNYSFPASLGTDPSNQPYQNLISEQEKKLVREMLEVFSMELGLQLVEQPSGGLVIGKGDLRSADPNAVNGPGGVAGLGGPTKVVLDALQGWTSDVWGGDFFGVMAHELGHAIQLSHAYDLNSVMSSSPPPGDMFPSDHDRIHLQRIFRPDSTDIDLYKFTLPTDGTFSAEVLAERLAPASQLNSLITLFDSNGKVVARNDDFYGNDSFLNLSLKAGTYHLGVSSTGNDEYDPRIVDTGFGGTTEGAYGLNFSFEPAVSGSAMTDTDGTPLDGDGNGSAGARHTFWFEVSDPSNDTTIYVDKNNDTTANAVDGNGSISAPFDTISAALREAAKRIVVPMTGGAAIQDGDRIVVTSNLGPSTFTFVLGGATTASTIGYNLGDAPATIASNIRQAINTAFGAGTATVSNTRVVNLGSAITSLDVHGTPALLKTPNLVRIVGNPGLDGNLARLTDNRPYLIGLDNSGNPLPDGSEFVVPQGTTVMVDGGALFKLRKANVDAGTVGSIDRQGAAIQVLGTPLNSVFFRSLRDDSVGGDNDGVGPAAAPGDYGGIVFRADSDMEDDLVYLNYVNHGNFRHGGGKVFVESQESVFSSIHIDDARPTVSFNVITHGADAAVSANPNSFDDANNRIGPDIHGNYLTANTINGLFVRIETALGSVLDTLDVNSRWNDTDITHVVTENLLVTGNSGGDERELGVLQGRPGGRLMIDPGTVVKLFDSRIELTRGQSGLIAEGTPDRPIIFTSVLDDRFGGSGSFDASKNGASSGNAGDWAGILLNHNSHASIDNALLSFAGGDAPIEGGSANFSVIEVHQAKLRLTNSTIEENQILAPTSTAATARNGRGPNSSSVIHVRGAQPVIIDNDFKNNVASSSVADATLISINANSLRSEFQPDYGRSTGELRAFNQFVGNHGPLVRLNRLQNNATNGMDIRAEVLTTESIWDDTDIAHILRKEILVGNHHTYSGLKLQSNNEESLVVKLKNTPVVTSQTVGQIRFNDIPGGPDTITDTANRLATAGFRVGGQVIVSGSDDNDKVFEIAAITAGQITLVPTDQLTTEDAPVGTTLNLPAGFTAFGDPLDIDDRIGGTVQVIGAVGHPVIMTSLFDDEVGAGFTPDGQPVLDTNNDGQGMPTTILNAHRWRGIWLDRFSNDTNMEVIRELENVRTSTNDTNANPTSAHFLGTLAPSRDSGIQPNVQGPFYKLGDENIRHGFQVHGFISPDDPTDVDVYSFSGTAGTPVYFDVDLTSPSLDAMLELISINGTLQARALDMPEAGGALPSGTAGPVPVANNPVLGGDYYSLNRLDPGMSLVLPGTPGTVGTYFVRVRSTPSGAIDTLKGPGAGQTSGNYQLQIRLQQRDQKPGSAVKYSDLRFADTAIDIRGLPLHTPLLGETAETTANNDLRLHVQTQNQAQPLGDIFKTEAAAISFAGQINTATNGQDVDWYRFDLNHQRIQAGSVPSGTAALVFDLDYADGAVQADATISVFDSLGNLIFVGRQSNVADDQPAPGQGTDLDDLSRGSLGVRDPFIGPVHIPVGTTAGTTYYIAITSDRIQAPTLNGFFEVDPAGNAELTRLEPINSVKRIVEDHVGTSGYTTNSGTKVNAGTAFDLSSSIALNTHVVPFTLNDVRLFVSRDLGNTNQPSQIWTANPFRGGDNSLISSTSASDLRDITFRSDGRLYGYRNLTTAAQDTNNDVDDTVGQLVQLDGTTGATLGQASDGIRGESFLTFPFSPTTPFDNDITYSDSVGALAFRRTGPNVTPGLVAGDPQYDLYYAVNDGPVSKLFLDQDSGAPNGTVPTTGNRGFVGYIGGATLAKTTQVLNLTLYAPNGGVAGNNRTLRLIQDFDAPPGANNPEVTIDRINNVIEVRMYNNCGATTLSADAVRDAINAVDSDNDDISDVVDVGIVLVTGDGTQNIAGTPPANPPNPPCPDAALGWPGGLERPGDVVSQRTTTGGVNGVVAGNTTGLAFVGNRLFGVSNGGSVFELNPSTGAAIAVTTIGGANFEGLTAGPRNVSNGAFSNMVFAIEGNGALRAFDLSLNPQMVFDSGTDGIADSFTINTGLSSATGLTFSPLDFNLWHPTMRRGSDAGHGILGAADQSRSPGAVGVQIATPGFGPDRSTTEGAGGASFYFGLEDYVPNPNSGSATYLPYTNENTQFGIRSSTYHHDLTSGTSSIAANTYDLPGGALGRLQSAQFSLTGYSSTDEPTLYFNYFLGTENYAGKTVGGNNGDPFRDSARVFISSNNGATWELLATNNSQLSSGNVADSQGQAELPSFLSHNADAALNSSGPRPMKEQQVQELFDGTGWRQARIDLSAYSGQSNLQLRFDFSTSGSMNDPTLRVGGRNLDGDCDAAAGNVFGQHCSTSGTIAVLNNAFEGFYIDDIIIGFAERGEMVTGAVALPEDNTMTDLWAQGRTSRQSDPNVRPDNYVGTYQVEIRRAGEYADLDRETGATAIRSTFDTNDRHIQSPMTVVGRDGFESGNFSSPPAGGAWATPPTDPISLRGTNITWGFGTNSPWTVSTVSPNQGDRAARGSVAGLASGLQLKQNYSQAGLIRFAYQVNSTNQDDGLAFFIDGVLQSWNNSNTEFATQPTRYLATGNTPYTIAEYHVGRGNHTFTWVTANTNSSNPQIFIDDVQVIEGGTGLYADDNKERHQGQLIIDSNFISNAATYGISVQAGARTESNLFPHPGSMINFPLLNTDKLAPGVVIQNNVVVASATGSGIRFSGDTNLTPGVSIPFGRIVNNTVFGGSPTQSTTAAADVIFLQDTTASMAFFIDEVVNQLLTMDTAMQAAGISARYGAVRLPESSDFQGGDDPKQVQDITDFATFSAPGAPYPSLANDTGGADEDGSLAVLEALNAFDPPSGATTFNYTPGSRIVTVLITTENDDSVAFQANALAALAANNAVFFGIIDPDVETEGGGTAITHYAPFANATGGQIFDIDDFNANPDIFFDAFVQALIGVIAGSQAASGIVVENNASPTIMNNVVSGFQDGIRIDGTSQTTVLASNAFRDNNNNVVGAGVGSSPLLLQPADPLFSNPFRGNFYPADDSKIVDSSLNTLQDRSSYATFKRELGIPQSPIFAPERDVYGQLRVDSAEDPIGGGASVFKDRGAVDKADDERPYAQLIIPVDNDTGNLDLDPNATVVYRTDLFLDQFSILLGDGAGPNSPFQGTGINARTVDIPSETSDPLDPNATVSQRAIRITRNGQPLVEDRDYRVGYNTTSNMLLLTPLSSLWEPNSVYVVTLDNTLIQDLAGNFLRDNQQSGATTFTIILGEFEFDYGDAPDASYGTMLNSDGARHVIFPQSTTGQPPLRLGANIDHDADGQPRTPPAVPAADDISDGDDRDQRIEVGTSALTKEAFNPYTLDVPGNGGAGGAGGITDGQTFTVDDGVTSVTFEFNLESGALSSPTNVSIPYYLADPMSVMAKRVADAINEAAASQGMFVTATELGGGSVFVNSPMGLLTIDLSSAPGLRNSDRLPIGLRVPTAGALIAEGQTFVVSDGVNPPVTFEFDDTSNGALPNPNNYRRVEFDASNYDADAIAQAIAAAIDAAQNAEVLEGLTSFATNNLVTVSNSTMFGAATSDDEDGVVFNGVLTRSSGTGYAPSVTVTANGDGFLDAWIDWNRNGAFEASEKIINSVPVTAGSTDFALNVPATAVVGSTKARFRISTTGGLFPTGLGIGGEVEDHDVRILDNVAPVIVNSFASFIDSYDSTAFSAIAGVLDVEEDQVHDAVGPGIDFELDLENFDGGANGTVANGFTDNVFDDGDIHDGDADTLTYRVVSVSNAAIVTTAVVGTKLRLNFLPDANDNRGGRAVIVVEARDHAGLTVRDSLTVSVKAINDPPVITYTAASPQVVDEDALLRFGLATGNPITVSDVDAEESAGADNTDGGRVAVTLQVSHGVLTLGNLAMLTQLTGNGTSTVTFHGRHSAVTAALNGLTYDSNPDYNENLGPETLVITIDDQGNTGRDDLGTIANLNIPITVTPLNDLPVIGFAGVSPQVIDEDSPLIFNAGSANIITVTDVDAEESAGADNTDSGRVSVTLAVGHGVLTLGSTANLMSLAGNGTSTITFRARQADVTAALNGLRYDPDADYNRNLGPENLVIRVNDQGNTGRDDLGTISNRTIPIAVTAVNDLPDITYAGGPQTVDEEGNLVFVAANGTAIVVSDTDAEELAGADNTDSGRLAVTLQVTGGTLALGTTSNLTALSGNGTSTITFRGLQADVTAALSGLTYTPNLDFNVNRNAEALVVTINDQGNTGRDDLGTISVLNVPIMVTAVNDLPVITFNGALPQVIDEDSPLIFNVANSNAISISDTDAGELTGPDNVDSGRLAITLKVTHGTLLLGSTANLTSLSGNGTSTVTFHGLPAHVSTALTNLRYNPNPNYNRNLGPETLVVTADDQGNTGRDDSGTVSTLSVPINVTAVNDVPSIAFAGAVPQVVDEDDALFFNVGSGNAIVVTDADSSESAGVDHIDSGRLEVTLQVSHGLLTLGGTANLVAVSGNGTAFITFRGLPGDITAALNNLRYDPHLNYNENSGADTLMIRLDDQGNTGRDDAGTITTRNIPITVSAINDLAEVVFAGTTPQRVDEEGVLVFSPANGNAITVSDADAQDSSSPDHTDAGRVAVTLQVSHGRITLGGTSNLSGVSGNGTSTITLRGQTADVTAALQGLRYEPDTNYNSNLGPETLVITVDDQGNTGRDDLGTVTVRNIPITVLAVNDLPTVTFAGVLPQTVDEDASLLFNVANGNSITVADLDAGESAGSDNVDGGRLAVTLQVAHGTLTLGTTASLTMVSGNGTATVTFHGRPNEVTTALAGLRYDPDANYTLNQGNESLVITVNDQGNTGFDGQGTTTVRSVSIAVTPINDEPSIRVTNNGGVTTDLAAPPAFSVTTNEDTNFVFGNAGANSNGALLSIFDDAAESPSPDDTVRVTMSVVHGTLTLGTVPPNLAFSVGDGSSDVSMTFIGTIADINAALANMTYDPDLDFNTNNPFVTDEVLTIFVEDFGNTGRVDAGTTTTRQVPINVVAINDLPVLNLTSATPTAILEASGPVSVVGIRLDDIDETETPAPSNMLELTLQLVNAGGSPSTTSGSLTVSAGTTGATVTVVDAATVRIRGTEEALDAILAGTNGRVTYSLPSAEFNDDNGGPVRIKLTADDLGQTGLSPTGTATIATLTINVVDQNDAPEFDLVKSQITVLEDSSATQGSVTATLQGVVANMRPGPVGAADEAGQSLEFLVTSTSTTGNLAFELLPNNQPDIHIDATTGDLTFRAKPNTNGTTILEVRLKDDGGTLLGGSDTSTVKRITLTVTAVNDAPVLVVDADKRNPVVNEDNGLTIVANWATTFLAGPVSTGATDETAQQLSFVVDSVTTLPNDSDPATGDDLSFAVLPAIDPATGDLSFRTSANTNGMAEVVVRLVDNGANGTANGDTNTTQPLTFTIKVNAVNDPPAPAPHAYTMVEDGGNTSGAAATTPLTINTVDITTTPATKDAPGPANEANQTLRVVSVNAVSAFNGTVTLSADGSTISYTPAANFTGQDTFTYTVEDNGSVPGATDNRSATGTVTVNVSAVNDVPLARHDSYSIQANEQLIVAGVGVLVNDSDVESALSVQQPDSITSSDLGATVDMDAAGSFTYDPTAVLAFQQLSGGAVPQTLVDRFRYRAVDSQSAASNEATVSITVIGVNDAPVSTDDNVAMLENDAVITRPFISDDVDNDDSTSTLRFQLVAPIPLGQGTLTINGDGTWTFNVGTDFDDLVSGQSRVVKFSYQAIDRYDAVSNTSSVTITVNGENDSPTTVDVAVNASEDSTVVGFFTGDDRDSDDDPSSLFYSIVTDLPATGSGVVTANGGRDFIFDPRGDFDDLVAGQSRVVTFTYRATDGQLAASNVSTVRITVNGQNDAPTAAAVIINATEDGSTVTGQFNGDDRDSDDNQASLVYSIVSGPAANQGTLIVGTNGSFSYSPEAGFQGLAENEQTSILFRYRARDRHNADSNIAESTINITGRNDAPTVSGVQVSTSENAPVTASFAGDDVDSDDDQASLSYSIVGNIPATQGSVVNHDDGTFTFNPGSNFDNLATGETASVVFTYQAFDSRGANSGFGSVTVTVVGSNDAPTAGAVNIAATEDGPVASGELNGDDIDSNDDPNSLVYEILSSPAAGSLTLTGGRTVQFNPGTEFQALGIGQTQDVTFTYRATDRFGSNSAVGTGTITVTGVNDAPAALNVGPVAAIEDGGPVSGTLNGSDVDADDASAGLVFAVVAQPSEGTASVSSTRGNASFTFDPANGFQNLGAGQTRSVTFTYSATDTHSTTSTNGTVTVQVTGVNDAPVASDVSGVNAQEDGGPVSANFVASDPDQDGTSMTFVIVSQPSEGSVTTSGTAGDNMFTFDPGTNFQDLAVGEIRNVTFTYRARDVHGVESVVRTVTVSVVGQNEAPVAQPGNLDAEAGSAQVSGQFTATDEDSDETGAGLVYSIVSQPSAGAVTVSSTPGDRTFTFDASTGFTDLAEGQERQVTFTYRVTDTHGAQSAVQTVTVTVTGINEAPTAAALNASAIEDGGSISASFRGDDVDSDDSPTSLSYAIISAPAAGQGTLTNNGNGSFSFNPGTDFQALAAGETSQVTFTYRATDRHGVTSPTATATIAVAGSNDAPTTVLVSATTDENTSLTRPLGADDVDSDDSGASLKYTLVTNLAAGQGAVVLNSDGTFTFNPGNDFASLAQGATQVVSFTYRATDRHGVNGAVGTVSLTVTGVNDAPVAQPIQAAATEHGADVTLPFTADDADSDDDSSSLQFNLVDAQLSAVINQQSVVIATLVNNGNGTFTVQPSPALTQLAQGQTVTATARYRATDRHGLAGNESTITVTMTGVNDAPVARDDVAAATEDAVLVASVPGVLGGATDPNRDTDPDAGDEITVFGFDNTSALGASVTVQTDGSFRYDPRNVAAINALGAGTTTQDTFRYTIQDRQGVQSTATVTVTVTGTNDVPVAVADQYTANANEAFSVSARGILLNDQDVDGDAINAVPFTGTSSRGAAVEVLADGSFNYFPASVAIFQALPEGQSLTDTFVYQVTDGAGGTVSSQVTITVVGVNDAPVAANDNYSISEDNTLTVPRVTGVARNDTDPEGAALTASVVSNPTMGTLLSFNADGSFSYRPNANASGTDTFTYRVSDGNANSNVATVTIQVTPFSDPPTAVNDSYNTPQGQALNVAAANGVLTNDSDIDDTALTAVLVRSTTNGSLDLESDGSFTYTPAAGFFGTDSFTYRAVDVSGNNSTVATVTISVTSSNPWHNSPNGNDVNNDGFVTPIDVLVVINDLNARGSRPLPIPPVPPFTPPPFLDVNNDRSVTPQDALVVINFLNRGGAEGESLADAEGESSEFDPADIAWQPIMLASPTFPSNMVLGSDELLPSPEDEVEQAYSGFGAQQLRHIPTDGIAMDTGFGHGDLDDLIAELAADEADGSDDLEKDLAIASLFGTDE